MTALTKALQDCNTANQTIIYFPKGRYDFWSESADKRVYFESNTYALNPKTSPIMIENKKNIVFEGQGSEFVFHGSIHAFVADHSENIEIRNLSFDWEIPLNADAEILDVTDSVLVLKINKTESPYVIEKGKLYFTGEGWKEKWSGANMEF